MDKLIDKLTGEYTIEISVFSKNSHRVVDWMCVFFFGGKRLWMCETVDRVVMIGLVCMRIGVSSR